LIAVSQSAVVRNQPSLSPAASGFHV
jgi:hypothetical protein